jgi:hypothetical protein
MDQLQPKPPPGDDIQQQLRAAIEVERRLWNEVKGRHPGQSRHDANAWQAWLAAERRVKELTQLQADPVARQQKRPPTTWN